MDNFAIRLTNLSKVFNIRENRKDTLRMLVTSFFNQGRTRKFMALDHINLTINKGDFLGIIGRNGSGKSTLLKLISGIYNPDNGSKIEVDGKVVPFLELGVGFNQELSGRENVFLNGAILGMSQSYLQEKYGEIVDFAELHDFMEQPVKNYSSGMIVRLAFSIAIMADGDIYILDEILAVGDEHFQKKSLQVIERLRQEHKTILFVSHAMEAIQQYCNRAILLHDAQIAAEGDPATVVQKYRELSPIGV